MELENSVPNLLWLQKKSTPLSLLLWQLSHECSPKVTVHDWENQNTNLHVIMDMCLILLSQKKKKDILSWAGPSKVFSEAYFHVPHYWTLRHCQCHSLWSYIILCLQGLSKFWNSLPCYCLPLHYLLTD